MHVLLVEDDLPLGAALQRALQLGGYQCTWVRRVVDAWVQLGAEVHAALLLDINLPDGSGFDMLQELSGLQPRLPTILISARDTLGDKLSGLQAGADDYLTKPFNARELVARIHAILRRAKPTSAAESPEVLHLGLLTLETGLRRTKVGEESVTLTDAEFRILELLVRNAGRVVTRSEITRRALGRKRLGLDRSVDTHVSNLRRKLGLGENGLPEIRSIRGAGYVLIAAGDSRPDSSL